MNTIIHKGKKYTPQEAHDKLMDDFTKGNSQDYNDLKDDINKDGKFCSEVKSINQKTQWNANKINQDLIPIP